MITTTKALDALKSLGLIIDWKMKSYNDDGLKWKSPVVKSDKVSVSNETYGKKSCLYFRAVSAEIAQEIAKAILAIGGQPSFGWCNDDPKCFELQVSNFHGYHWWE